MLAASLKDYPKYLPGTCLPGPVCPLLREREIRGGKGPEGREPRVLPPLALSGTFRPLGHPHFRLRLGSGGHSSLAYPFKSSGEEASACFPPCASPAPPPLIHRATSAATGTRTSARSPDTSPSADAAQRAPKRLNAPLERHLHIPRAARLWSTLSSAPHKCCR